MSTNVNETKVFAIHIIEKSSENKLPNAHFSPPSQKNPASTKCFHKRNIKIALNNFSRVLTLVMLRICIIQTLSLHSPLLLYACQNYSNIKMLILSILCTFFCCRFSLFALLSPLYMTKRADFPANRIKASFEQSSKSVESISNWHSFLPA